MPPIGPLELVIVLVIVLVIFGPKKLPGLGRSLGTGMREFKDSITGKDNDDKRSITGKDDDDKRSITASDDDEPTTPEQHDDAIRRDRG